MFVDLHVDDAAIAHRQHPVRHAGDVGVVRDDHRAGAQRGIDLIQRRQHPHTGGGVECSGGLVAQQHGRLLGNGARNGHPLLLATRHLRRKMVQPAIQPHQRQCILGAHRVPGDLGDDGHVLARRQAGNEVVELEDETHVVAPELGERAVIGMSEILPVVPDAPRRGHIQPAEDVQQRRFAAARRPQNHHELARMEFEVDAAQRMHLHLTHPVDAGDALGTEHHRRSICPACPVHPRVRPRRVHAEAPVMPVRMESTTRSDGP